MNLIEFTSGNRFSYAVFNKILNFFYNYNDVFFKKFKDYGYSVVKLKNLETLQLINNEISLQKSQNEGVLIKYDINNNLIFLLDRLISEQKIFIDKLKEYFFCPVVVSNIEIKRTKFINKAENKNKNKNIYSENYHIDKYLNTHIKQFIYLSDVDKNCGPFIYIDKKDTKRFIKKYGFKNRFSLDILEGEKLINREFEKIYTGKMGSSLIVNTTECLHRAGIPVKGNFRDIITITYVAVPSAKYKNEKYFLNNFKSDFFSNKNDISKKLAKPTQKKDLIIFFFKYLKFRLFKY